MTGERKHVDMVMVTIHGNFVCVHTFLQSLPPVFGGTFEPVPMDAMWGMIEERKPELKPRLES